MSGISVGQLRTMTAERRSQVIATISPDQRRKLAHLASIAWQKKAHEAAEYVQIAIELTREES